MNEENKETNKEKNKTSNLVVWVAISKSDNVIVFSDEPKLVNDEWEGNIYLNSSIYPQIERLVKHSSMTHTSSPEQIVFTLK